MHDARQRLNNIIINQWFNHLKCSNVCSEQIDSKQHFEWFQFKDKKKMFKFHPDLVMFSIVKRCLVRLYLQLFIGGLMSYLRYLCLFTYSGVQHISFCVFVLFFFVLSTLICQFLWIVHLWLALRYSLTFICRYRILIQHCRVWFFFCKCYMHRNKCFF